MQGEGRDGVCTSLFSPPVDTVLLSLFVCVCMRVSVYVCVGLTEDKGMWSESALCPLSFPPYSTHPKVCVSLDEFSIFCLLLQADAALLSQRRDSSTDSSSSFFFFFCLSTATRGGHHSVLCGSTGAGRAGRHVLQQLLPLPDIRPGPGSEQCYEPVGAERAPGRREVSGHTGPLMDRRRRGRGGQLAKEESERKQLMFR